MAVEVEFTDEFGEWWEGLPPDEQDSVRDGVELLRQYGVSLPFPYSSGVAGSAHSHMRELRVHHAGRPFRILYAFNPLRTGILLIGGDKTGNGRWYETFVPIADRLYDEHLKELKQEGLI
ncbi:MAG TPA: type II toxin-antitoxin system RelE/ParE family toxin [Bryobacteraceae bacterium]|nr:type II toxin-antitoxin system RelE/ParE family toxin [Bryobacteraceae bacterium]